MFFLFFGGIQLLTYIPTKLHHKASQLFSVAFPNLVNDCEYFLLNTNGSRNSGRMGPP